MPRHLARLVILASAGLAAASLGATAQPASREPSTEERLAWARRHVELVCRQFEARQMFERATRCYNDATRLVSDAKSTGGADLKSKPGRTAPAGAAKPAPKPSTLLGAPRSAA